MKFPFIFIIILIILQFLAYNFARVLMWQFDIRHFRLRKYLIFFIFLFTDGMLLIHALRLVKIFRVAAGWMIVLWFVFLVTATVVILAKILSKTKYYRKNSMLLNRHLRILSPVLLAGLLSLALYNAYVPVVKRISIQIDKPLAQPVKIGMAADTHLGVMVGARQLDQLAGLFQSEQVDIILLAGDIMDDNTVAYEAENMQPHLAKLRAPLGAYATLGNHDMGRYDVLGSVEKIRETIEKAGIKVLYDDVLKVDNRFWLVGRPDRLDMERAQTVDLLKETNPDEPVFLIDHRPDDIPLHADLPIDLQVSGHVHNGQVFPINLLVRFMNRVHYGYEQINQGHFVVTSGFGFWGVPFRLGSQAEVWIIEVSGKK